MRVDGIIGVSAGAVFGVNFLSGQHGRVIRYNKKYSSDKRYMGMHSLFKTGDIVNKEFAYYTVAQKLDIFDNQAFMASNIPYYAVVTNMETGQPEYMQINNVFEDMEILRASASMPFLSRPVVLNGQKYLDGGVSDSIPYKKFLEMGYDRLIVVLTRDLNCVKKPMSKHLVSLYYRNFPNFREQLLHRHNNYNQSISELKTMEANSKVVIIRPSEPIEISRMEKNPQVLQSVYELGRKDAEEICKSNLTKMK
ncbi:MAG: patatin family protein [Ruminococcus sp.]